MSKKICIFVPAMTLDLYSNEALFLKPQEKDTLAGLMTNIRTELMNAENDDDVQDDIIRDYIQLILDYCNRFYARQFKEMTAGGSSILASPTSSYEHISLNGTHTNQPSKGVYIKNRKKVIK